MVECQYVIGPISKKSPARRAKMIGHLFRSHAHDCGFHASIDLAAVIRLQTTCGSSQHNDAKR